MSLLSYKKSWNNTKEKVELPNRLFDSAMNLLMIVESKKTNPMDLSIKDKPLVNKKCVT